MSDFFSEKESKWIMTKNCEELRYFNFASMIHFISIKLIVYLIELCITDTSSKYNISCMVSTFKFQLRLRVRLEHLQ